MTPHAQDHSSSHDHGTHRHGQHEHGEAPAFDRDFWESHWHERGSADHGLTGNNVYLDEELSSLNPGEALDAGCGQGYEALWLAERGWQVTGADLSETALAAARSAAERDGLSDRARFIQADLTSWVPGMSWDLVMTNYAHPSIPQLDFYEQIAAWVRPAGTLLIVGHLDGHGHAHGAPEEQDLEEQDIEGEALEFPAESTVTVADIVARFDQEEWEVVTARTNTRSVGDGDGIHTLKDAVVRLKRR